MEMFLHVQNMTKNKVYMCAGKQWLSCKFVTKYSQLEEAELSAVSKAFNLLCSCHYIFKTESRVPVEPFAMVWWQYLIA